MSEHSCLPLLAKEAASQPTTDRRRGGGGGAALRGENNRALTQTPADIPQNLLPTLVLEPATIGEGISPLIAKNAHMTVDMSLQHGRRAGAQ